MMRRLVATYGRNEDRVCREYALAEERAEVQHQRNEHRLSAAEYARALSETESGVALEENGTCLVLLQGRARRMLCRLR